MPIVDIEVVAGATDAALPGKERLQLLTDELGDVFESDPRTTWVKLKSIDESRYAENRTGGKTRARPVFVNVLRARLPATNAIRREMAEIAEIVARSLNRPRENVHVLYETGATGRIGFGGRLPE